jgi:hypothetical protein
MIRGLVHRLGKRLPYLKGLVAERDRLRAGRGRQAYPPGHFYSPIPSPEEVRRDAPCVWAEPPRELPGIDLNEAGQLRLFEAIRGYSADLPFTDEPTPGLRDHYRNEWFSYGDAVVLACLLRHLRPGRVIEVGSGYSSAVLLDVHDRFLGGGAELTFIDPNPEQLYSLPKDRDRQAHRVLGRRVQDVD